MTEFVIKEKLGDKAYNLIYILLLVLNISVVFLLSAAGGLMDKIHKSKWFTEEEYMSYGEDVFFGEKFKLVYNVSTVFIIVAQAVISIILFYIILSHINKWKTDMALLYTIGYTDKNMIKYLFLRNLIDSIPVLLISGIITCIIWKTLVTGRALKDIIDESGVTAEMDFLKMVIIYLIIFAVQMIISIINYKKQKTKNIRNVVED